LQTLRGDRQTIVRDIEELKSRGSNAWLEVLYEGREIAGDLRALLEKAVEGTGLEILLVKNKGIVEHALSRMTGKETLDDLDVTDVFERCLEAHDIPMENRPAFLSAYQEILISLNEEDPMAE
jgi:exonuclease SbcD